MTNKSRLGTWAGRGAVALGALLGAAALTVALLLGVLQTGYGKKQAARIISALASTEQITLTLTGLDGNPPFNTSLQNLELADAQGVLVTGQNIEVKLSILDLVFRRRVNLPELSARSLTVYRMPEQGPPKEKKPVSARLELPSVRVGDLTITRLTLKPPLVSDAREFSVSGEMSSQDKQARLSLEVRGLEQTTDNLVLAASFDGKTRELAVKADLEESPGGLIGNLLALPEPAAVTAALEGQGKIEAWQGALDARAQNTGELNAEFTLSKNKTYTAKIKGSLAFRPGVLPPELTGRLGEKFEFQAFASLPKARVLAVDDLVLETPTAMLDLRGEFDFEENSMTGLFTLIAKDSAALTKDAPVSLSGETVINGNFSGTPDRPVLQIKTELGQTRAGRFAVGKAGLAITLTGLGPRGQGMTGFAVQARAGLTQISSPYPEAVPQILEVSLNAQTPDLVNLEVSSLKISGPDRVAEISGSLDLKSGDFKTRLAAEAQNPDQAPAGTLTVSAETTGNFKTRAVDAQVSGNLRDISGLPDRAASLVGSRAEFSGQAGLRGPILEIPRFTLDSVSRLTASGTADIEKNSLDLEYELNPWAGVKLSENAALKNPAPITGRLTGPFTGLTLTAGTKAGQARYAGQAIAEPQAFVEISLPPGPVSGIASASGKARGLSVQARTEFEIKPDRVALTGLSARAPGALLNADGEVMFEPALVRGRARVSADDLALLGPALGMQASGSLRAEAEFAPDRGRQTLSLSGTGQDLSFKDVQAQTLVFSAQTSDVFSSDAWTVQTRLEQASVRDVKITEANVSARPGRGGARFSVTARGRAKQDFDLAAGGEMLIKESTTRVALSEFTGEYAGIPLELRQEAVIEKGPDRLVLSGLDLRLAESSITAEAHLGPGEVSADVRTQGMKFSLLNAPGADRLEGSLSARVTASGKPDDPTVNARIEIAGLRPAALAREAEFSVDMRAAVDLAHGEARINSRLTGLGPEPFTAEMTHPVNLTLWPLDLEIPETGRISARFRGPFDLAALNTILALDDQRVYGSAQADFTITGRLPDPDSSGHVTISGGGYENVRTGTVLKDVSAEMTAKGARLQIARAKASDTGEGRIELAGRVEMNPRQKFPYDLTLTMDHVALMDLDLFRAKSSGSLNLAGDATGATLGGEIEFDPAVLTIPARLPPDMARVNVTEINVPKKEQRAAPVPKGPDFALDLDVKVRMPARFYVRGRGLDSEWKGDLHVTGAPDKPAVRGNLTLVRGKYLFLDRNFDLVEGSLTFGGQTPPAPIIHLVGQTRTKDLAALVTLSGPLESADLELTSEPPLPREEILSALLFGRSLDSISPLQALRLAQVAGELSGEGGPALDILGGVRDVLGVDEIEVHETESGGMAVGVGTYIQENVYIKGEKSTATQEDILSVEIELTPNLTLESEVGTDSQGGVGLNWKIDY